MYGGLCILTNWFAELRHRRAALRMAMKRFEETKHTPADPVGCYVYLKVVDGYVVKVSGLWISQWYMANPDGATINELALPPSANT